MSRIDPGITGQGEGPKAGWLLGCLLVVGIAAVACGNGDKTAGTPSTAQSPTPTSTDDGQSIGEYDDANDFRSFAEGLDAAIDSGDTQFFLDNTRMNEVECDAEFPAPPASCTGQPASSTVPAVVVGVFQSEGFALDEAAYEEFIREYLTAYDQNAPDDLYGGPEPRLYAYGDFASEFTEVPPEGSVETVHAIATRIAPSSPELVPGPGRTALYIGVNLIEGNWQITHMHAGSAGYVSPFSPEASDVGADDLFEFWLRWEQ